MNKQKGLAPILIILLIAAAAGGYLVYTNYSTNQTKAPQQTIKSSPAPTDETANWEKMADSETRISPNGSFTVIQQTLADTQKIIIKNDQGKIITEDLVKEQNKEIGYNTKIRCMCATYFKDWVNDSKFSIKIE